MFDRLSNGWEVASQSWAVLRRDKQLVLFPILSGLAAILVTASFALPVFLLPGVRDMIQNLFNKQNADGGQADIARIVSGLILFAFYFLNYFVIVYFNTALAACAIYRFRGGEPTVGLGLKMAGQRLPQIAGWALLAATVGVILNAIEERSQWLGKLVVAILGGVWTAATYLVVPTLAVEGVGPITALKRSASLVSSVWGEGLTGNFSIGLIGFLISLPGILLLVGVAMLQPPTVVIVLVVLAALAYLLGVAVVVSAVKQVFIAGLYVYATEKRVPPGFDQSTMASAFASKK